MIFYVIFEDEKGSLPVYVIEVCFLIFAVFFEDILCVIEYFYIFDWLKSHSLDVLDINAKVDRINIGVNVY